MSLIRMWPSFFSKVPACILNRIRICQWFIFLVWICVCVCLYFYVCVYLVRNKLYSFVSTDQFRGVELDALHSSISALTARLRKHTQSLKGNASDQRKLISGRKNVQDTQVSLLKSSLEKLSLVNSENSEKVKLVESVLKGRESGRWYLLWLNYMIGLLGHCINFGFVAVVTLLLMWLAL